MRSVSLIQARVGDDEVPAVGALYAIRSLTVRYVEGLRAHPGFGSKMQVALRYQPIVHLVSRKGFDGIAAPVELLVALFLLVPLVLEYEMKFYNKRVRKLEDDVLKLLWQVEKSECFSVHGGR